MCLEIEQAEDGYFLFSCTDPGVGVWEAWHETGDEALSQAELERGVPPDSWTSISES
jgi:hypothetical protein